MNEKKLGEFIHAELQSGKTIGQIKKDISATRGGWSSKEISRAIRLAVEKELKQRSRQPQERSEDRESADANKMWLLAIVAALAAVVVVTLVIFYLLR